MRPEVDRIQSLIHHLDDLERQYKADRAAARAELREATRALADIGDRADRVETVIWAAKNTTAPKNDLAWVIFGKEHQEFHLRKLAKGPHRNCQKCRKQVYAGNRFEQSTFYCYPCEATVRADQQREWNDSERQWETKSAAATKRIAELKAMAGLSDVDAKELAALMVMQVDGPMSRLSDFITEGLNRQNGPTEHPR